MIPVVYDAAERCLIVKTETTNVPLLPNINWKRVSEDPSTNVFEALPGEVWEYSWALNKDPGFDYDIIRKQAVIVSSPEAGVKVALYSTDNYTFKSHDWRSIADPTLMRAKDVSFPPFDRGLEYIISVPRMFNDVSLSNIHKNEDGLWEGTTMLGEIKKWNPRLPIDYIEV